MKCFTENEFDEYIEELENKGAVIFSITENEVIDSNYTFDPETQSWTEGHTLKPVRVRTIWYNQFGENCSEDIEINFSETFQKTD